MFILAVQAFYAGPLMEMILRESKRNALRRSNTSLLAGDVFTDAVWLLTPASASPTSAHARKRGTPGAIFASGRVRISRSREGRWDITDARR